MHLGPPSASQLRTSHTLSSPPSPPWVPQPQSVVSIIGADFQPLPPLPSHTEGGFNLSQTSVSQQWHTPMQLNASNLQFSPPLRLHLSKDISPSIGFKHVYIMHAGIKFQNTMLTFLGFCDGCDTALHKSPNLFNNQPLYSSLLCQPSAYFFLKM